MNRLVDAYGRTVDYLRVSLTDACNFKCVYCVPSGGTEAYPATSTLSAHQVVRLARVAARMGVRRIRLTGGEPLLRADIVDIVAGIKSGTLIKDVSITTNGSRLRPLLGPLRRAGLDRINISLDSLERARFRSLCGIDAYTEVRAAFESAVEAGFPVKLNVVLVKGLGYEEVRGFVHIAKNYPVDVRFLEFMPLCGDSWKPDLVIPIDTVRRIVLEHAELDADGPRSDGVADTYRVRGGRGRIGFIGSLTESFCSTCSRVRVTAQGGIRPCLFSDLEIPIDPGAWSSIGDETIEEALREAVALKPAGNAYHQRPFDPLRDERVPMGIVMKKIGG